MGRNRTWTRDGSSSGFNPLGRRDDKPYGKGGKGNRDREVVLIREDRKDDVRRNDGGRNDAGRPGGGQMDKMSMRLLNLFCEKKWNSQSGMLDLSGIVKAEDLRELNCNLNNSFFCEKLAQTIAKGEAWAKSLNSINLSGNGIYTLKHVSQAFQHHDVRIQNLALNDNKIKELCEVDWLLDMKLREVLFVGNPIADLRDSYHRYVVKKLRTIELLDAVSVKDWRKELLPTLPEPRDSCMPDETHANLVFQMCRLYFQAVDQGNFDSLIDAYDTKCVFSHISEPSTRIYRAGSSKNYHSNLQFKSHNMVTNYNQKNPTKYIFQGRPAIIEFLRKDLYTQIQTKHDVSNFKADAVIMGDTVVATVHGMYTYTVQGDKQEHQRCFDRIFILRPNRVGTEWPARIANDSVTIRAIQDHAILLPSAPPPVMAAPVVPNAIDIKGLLMQHTGLNDTFAALLLKETDNNLERSLALFKQNQGLGLIPPEAFLK